jgi:lactate 2-monooxygenase
MYTFGSAGSSSTYRNNLEAFERWRIIPRMLRNTTDRNLEVSCAYLLSAAPRADPIASLDHPLWRKAPLAGARRSRGCTRNPTQGWRARDCEGSSKCRCATDHVDRGTRSIEAVAKANGDGHRWYQLYWYAFQSSSTLGRDI